ncbi:hypothetical protein AKJ65_02840 [candidate division MSBL1 archaeon SCGC-AAA259E19]|uniref:Uncharacterized protein n=1 Tax=candidate division MSBL1 archaeon SCGC-AAA259E19 TaxID=1698264 RepID=A0A133UL99_9EURY|nr:hypothetical protein AKJ65_02840 [candidate division MSBL1 archaeon SCGC-AAA259E19]
MGTHQIRAELSKAEQYLDLKEVHRERIRKVLRTVRSARKTRELRNKAGFAASYVDCFRDWLEEKEYIDHENRPTPRARPAQVPLLTKKGENLLMFIESPSLGSLGFKVDGGHKGTVELKPGRGNTFDVSQTATIMNLLDSGKSLTVGGPQLHADELGGNLILKYEIEKADKSILKLEEKMWRFIKNVLETTDIKSGEAGIGIRNMLPSPPAYWLPLELSGFPEDRFLADIYNAYWKKRLKKNEYERGDILIVPETPEEDPFTGYLFSIEEEVSGSGGALDNLKLGIIPPIIIAELEKLEGCSIPQDADLRLIEKTTWEIPDSTPPCRIVMEREDRVDVYEAGGPLPEHGWKFRRDLLRDIKELVEESEKCWKWLESRLERDPNFFMPAPYWRKLGFDLKTEKIDRVSPPYNTEPSEPKFLKILKPGLLYVLYKISEKWRKSPTPSAAVSLRIFSEFIGRLEELQEKKKFYNLWSILRKSSGTPFTEDIDRKFKDIKIFEPIDEATLRFYCEEELTDLSKAYSDLNEGRKNSIEELRKAIREGEYDL